MKKLIYTILGILLFCVLISKCSCGSDKTDSDQRICERCGKAFLATDKYYDAQMGYDISCSLEHCAKCSAEISRENYAKVWREGIKNARNKWVDENPNEARRRGIHKF